MANQVSVSNSHPSSSHDSDVLTHVQAIYSAAVISIVELSKSLADEIEESWNTERVLGEKAEGQAEAAAAIVEGIEEREGQEEAPPPARDGDIEEVLRTRA